LKRIIGEAFVADSIDNASKPVEENRPALRLDDDTPGCWINHGSSPALVELRTAISFSAEQRKGHALIVGEPGLEKRSVAMTLHHRARRSGNIVFVDCEACPTEALSENLFGGDSYGHSRHIGEGGSIARAVGGTLVLDNVDSLSRELQSALSMFLDTGVYKRRKAEASFKAVVAVVGIVSDQGKVGSLRTDFSARLGQVTLNIPSVCECVRDIPNIAQWLLPQSTGYQPHYTFSDTMMSQLLDAPWTHNISEMRELIQTSVDAKASSTDTHGRLELPQAHQYSNWDPFNDLVGLTLRDFGDQLIASTLAYYQGDKAQTAKALNISLKTLYNRLNSQ